MALPMRAKKTAAVSKAKKSMKVAKITKAKKTKKILKVATGKRAKSIVFRGTREKTSGGLKRDDLIRNKRNKVVSKKKAAQAKKRYSQGLGVWIAAVQRARKELGITGFCAVGGKLAQGKALYAKAKANYASK